MTAHDPYCRNSVRWLSFLRGARPRQLLLKHGMGWRHEARARALANTGDGRAGGHQLRVERDRRAFANTRGRYRLGRRPLARAVADALGFAFALAVTCAARRRAPAAALFRKSSSLSLSTLETPPSSLEPPLSSRCTALRCDSAVAESARCGSLPSPNRARLDVPAEDVASMPLSDGEGCCGSMVRMSAIDLYSNLLRGALGEGRLGESEGTIVMKGPLRAHKMGYCWGCRS